MSQPTYKPVTIANTGTTSSTYETLGALKGSFQLPTFTGTSLTINVSNDNTTFTACPVEGNEANPMTVSASGGAYSLPVKAFSFRYIQLVSGSAQGAARTILIVTRD